MTKAIDRTKEQVIAALDKNKSSSLTANEYKLLSEEEARNYFSPQRMKNWVKNNGETAYQTVYNQQKCMRRQFNKYIMEELNKPQNKNQDDAMKLAAKRVVNEFAFGRGKEGLIPVIRMLYGDKSILESIDEDNEQELDQKYKDINFLKFQIYTSAFNKQQVILMDKKSRFVLIQCGRRSGKTENAAKLIIDQATTPNSRILYVHLKILKVKSQLWPLLIQNNNSIGLTIEKEDKGNCQIKWDNGSTLQCIGNGTSRTIEDSAQGEKFDLIIIDEAQSQRWIKYGVEQIIMPTMMDSVNSRLFIQGSKPRQPNTYFEKLVNSPAQTIEVNGKPFEFAWTKHSWNMFENPFIPNPSQSLALICAAMGVDMESDIIKREYLNQDAYDTEAFIWNINKLRYLDNTGALPPYNAIAIGVDYGGRDSDAIVAVAYDNKTGKGFVFYEKQWNDGDYKTRKKYMDEIATMSTKMVGKSNWIFVADTNEVVMNNTVRREFGYPITTCKTALLASIQRLAFDMQVGNILIEKNEESPCYIDCKMTCWQRADDNDPIPNHIIYEEDEDIWHPNAIHALRYANNYIRRIAMGGTLDIDDDLNQLANTDLPPVHESRGDYDVNTDNTGDII
jgi:hypothetical protein